MTGLCALLRHDTAEVGAAADHLARAARRYGRQGVRSWTNGKVFLGRSLYPLLPEDHLDEPLDHDAARWIVAADVRLTERDDLATRLAKDPQAHSDASLVAAALERWGVAAFERLYGVFAIIAWDREEGRLVLARDALGERPLFYHAAADRFAAASMPDILLADPATPRVPDIDQYRQFMRMNAFAPGRCAFAGIGTVRPGHAIVVTGHGLEDIRWWRPDLTPLRLPTQRDYEDALAGALDAAVSACLRRNGGAVGAHLSSGFDSTAVATTAARTLAGRGERLTAFTAAPHPGPGRTMAAHHLADEFELAARTATYHPNLDLVRIVADHGPMARLDRARAIYPSPIVNLCNLPWFERINDAARNRGVTVLLHGLMGNSSISESGVWALRELFRQGRLRTWLKIARGLVRGGWMRWRGVLFNTFEDWLPDRAWRHAVSLAGRSVEDDRDMTLMADEAYRDAATAHRRQVQDAGDTPPGDDGLGRERHVTSVQYRLSSARTNGDGDQYKAMLAEWGIDLRDPTADRRLFELALRIPVERLIRDGEPRAILRRVLADRAPPEVLGNRRRGYQAADWAQAICQDREAFITELERLERYEPTAAIVDIGLVRRLIEELPAPGAAEWDSDLAENRYRIACLRTISAASHMRHLAGSNV